MTLKTHETNASVDDFIDAIPDEGQREDCKVLNKLCEKITGEKGKMWGTSIVGYGTYSYTRSDNKFYEFLALGFSPRKQSLTIYNIPGYEPYKDFMKKLGKYTTGKSCLYVKQLEDIDIEILEKLLSDGYRSVAGKHIDYKTGTWSE